MSFVLPVFGTNGSKKVLDFGRRSGSGDWVKDRVSWKEELQYKIDMGYMSHMHWSSSSTRLDISGFRLVGRLSDKPRR